MTVTNVLYACSTIWPSPLVIASKNVAASWVCAKTLSFRFHELVRLASLRIVLYCYACRSLDRHDSILFHNKF